MTTTPILEDFRINQRIKLSLLWISVMFCYVYGDYFELYAPHKTESLISGKNMLDNPIKLFLASLLMTIPALLIFLSATLKPILAKWVNIIFGSIYTAIMLLIAVTSLSEWYAFYVFLALVESILTAAIVVYAIRWPKSLTSK